MNAPARNHPWRQPSAALGQVEIRECRVCHKPRPVRSFPNNGKTCTDCSRIRKRFNSNYKPQFD